jgi:hypothetical protein
MFARRVKKNSFTYGLVFEGLQKGVGMGGEDSFVGLHRHLPAADHHVREERVVVELGNAAQRLVQHHRVRNGRSLAKVKPLSTQKENLQQCSGFVTFRDGSGSLDPYTRLRIRI